VLSLGEASRIFVAREPVDFRRQFDGLSSVAADDLDLDPFSGHFFVFFNRRRDRVKILVFQHNGFWLHYKRLERGTFEVPHADRDTPCVEVDARGLRLLLDGIDLAHTKFRRHFAHPVRIDRQRYGGA